MSREITPRQKPQKAEAKKEGEPRRDLPVGGVHLDTLEIAHCVLTIMDYLCSRFDDTVEMSDELKPILERILR